MFVRVAILSIAVTTLCAAGGLVAGDAPDSLAAYHHTAWTTADGAPANIYSMAQTRDGFLWLGTPSGLYRFDGRAFTRIDLQPSDSVETRGVSSVAVTADDRVVVGYNGGGVDVLPVSRLPGCCQTQGIPRDDPLGKFATGPHGETWALTQGAVYALSGERWTKVNLGAMGVAGEALDDVAHASDGSFFVSTRNAFYRLAPNATTFAPVPGRPEANEALMGGMDGVVRSIGLSREWVRLSALTEPGAPLPDVHASSDGSLFDSAGNHWRGARTVALRQTPRQPDPLYAYPIQADIHDTAMDAADGLSDHFAMSFYEDRDGNVWLGTKNGLDRFRRNTVSEIRFPAPLIYFAAVAMGDGAMFVVTAGEGTVDSAWLLSNRRPKEIAAGFVATAAFGDDDGTVLAGSEKGLFRLKENGQLVVLSVPVADKGTKVQAIARDGLGRLWVSFRGKPVEMYDGKAWVPKGALPLPDAYPARMVRDANGDLWLGYFSNRVDVVGAHGVTSYGSEQGLALGTVTAILPGSPIFLGGERGLAILSGGHARTVLAADPERLNGITGMVRTPDGALWLNGLSGGLRIAADELRAAEADPGHVVHVRTFSTSDGMPGTAQQVRPLPTLVAGSDGVLWFAANSGLATVDPGALPAIPSVPRVVIDSVSADGTPKAVGNTLSLPAGTHDLGITYVAPTLSTPERLEYRYRLEGLDDGWREVGHKLEATYTNLRAGTYRFEVEAANEEGRWSGHPTTLPLTIAPRFTETRWFWLLCTLTALLLVELLYVTRLRFAARAVGRRLRIEALERERIARDLHDTLLQGIQGLLLQLKAWVKDSRLSDAYRGELADAIETTRSMLVEGRDRIMDLRRNSGEMVDLQDALKAGCRSLGPLSGSSPQFMAEGEVPVRSEAAGEIVAIVTEAVRNAFMHASPTRVLVRSHYTKDALLIEVSDDGVGIDDKAVRADAKPGHWGVAGMHERAERIGGRLVISHGISGGTVVSLRIDRSMAYGRSKGWRFRRRNDGQ
jgi:signal transduction histidine kinase/ligand-binding sensor domain-containing protein